MIRLFILILLILPVNLLSQTSGNASEDGPAEVVDALYSLVSVEKGKVHDWDKVRSLFFDDAIILLRTSREATTIFDVEGFIADFVKFAKDYKIVETGFTETIIKRDLFEFGDIAHMVVLYEVNIPVEGFKPQRGVDSIQLIKRDGAWKIFSITNEVPMPGRELPVTLKGQKPKV